MFRKWSIDYEEYSGGSTGGAQGTRAPPLFLDQNEARRAEKNFFEAAAPPATPPPPLATDFVDILFLVHQCYVPLSRISKSSKDIQGFKHELSSLNS